MQPGFSVKRLVAKIADRMNIQESEGFPWSKGIPKRNFPRPMTGGSGCMAPVVLVLVLTGILLAFAVF